MFVEKEDRNPGHVDELVDLPFTCAASRRSVAVGGRLADSVRLIADQDIKDVLLIGHETVEVLEEVLHFALPGAGDLAHGPGEGLRTGGVERRHALTVQLAEHGERDDALARSRTTRDDHDLLVVGPLGLAHGVEHHPVGDLLLVQENELLAVPHLLRRDGHQLPGGHRGAAEELVGSVNSRISAELGTQVIEELATSLSGEHLALVVKLDGAQPPDTEFGRVVEVGHTADPVRVPGDSSVEVGDVLAVPAYLFDGVEHGTAVPTDLAERRIVLIRRALAPLLELHHDIGRFTGDRVGSGEDRVGALAVQRQRVLEDDLDSSQACLVERGDQYGDAPLPGARLGGPCPVTVQVVELLVQVEEERAVQRHGGDGLCGRAEQQGNAPRQHERDSCGWGHVRTSLSDGAEARRAAMVR